MPVYDWKPFLQDLSRAILADEALRAELPPDVVASEWLGFPGASEDEIAMLENRLGAKLPPSYREFLSVSNGWRTLGAFIYEIWPTAQVDWYKVHNQELIDAWLLGESDYEELYGTTLIPISDEEYFVYGEEQPSETMRSEYLQTALEISDRGDAAILLLNPKVVFDNGEWEAWFHAYWLPGANRYRSFWELMNDMYKRFLALRSGK